MIGFPFQNILDIFKEAQSYILIHQITCIFCLHLIHCFCSPPWCLLYMQFTISLFNLIFSIIFSIIISEKTTAMLTRSEMKPGRRKQFIQTFNNCTLWRCGQAVQPVSLWSNRNTPVPQKRHHKVGQWGEENYSHNLLWL